jgi:hypothetical protein
MIRRHGIWKRIAAAVLVAVVLPASLYAETFMRSEDILRVSAYQVPIGLQLAAPSAAHAAMQSGTATGLTKTPEDYGQNWRALRTTGEIVLMNAVMTLFGKYFMDEHGFAVSWDTITENLKNGFEWDDNSFSANNFRHPYQGAQYFGAARSSHYDFWQSSMWAFFGSWLFEYAGEAHHPSYNDWINTAIGGIGLGEPLFRLQSMALDNTATGSSRVWRELGGFLILPLAGFNRMVTGAAFEEHQNPPDDKPDYFGGRFDLGTRTLSDGYIWEEDRTRMYVDFYLRYGHAFKPIEKPYDAFSFRIQLTFKNKPHGISRLQSRGVLASANVYESDESQHMLSADQFYDYIDNEAYTYGGQTIAASYFSRFWKGESFEARTQVSLGAIILGANKSDYFNISGREYDYGPGAGYVVGVEFARKKRNVFSISTAGFWIHSVNGTRAEHYNRITTVRVDLPVKQYLGVGADYVLYEAERHYKDYPDVKTRNPELKLYLAWFME